MSRVDVTMGIKNAKFQTGVEQSKKKVRELKKVAGSGFSLGKVSGAGALIASLTAISQKYDRIGKLTKRFGLDSVETLQGLGFAAEQNGSDIETLAKALQQGNRSAIEAAQGNATYQRSFEALGISVDAFAKLNQEEQFLAIADAISVAEDKNEALANAQNLLGRSAGELMPLLRQGSAEIRELAESINTLNDAEIANLERFNDSLNKIKTNSAAAAGSIFSVLIPAIESLGSTTAGTIRGVQAIGDSLRDAALQLRQGEFKKALGSALSSPKDGFDAGLQTTLDSLKEVWGEAGKEAGEAYSEAFDFAAANGGSSAPGSGSSQSAEGQARAQAQVAKRLAEAQANYAEEVAKTAESRRDEFQQLFFLLNKLQDLRRLESQARAGGDEASALGFAASGQAVAREIEALEKSLDAAAEAAALSASETLVETMREALQKQVEELEGRLRDTQARQDGFRAQVDGLTSIGVGLAGVSNQQPQAFRELERLEREQLVALKSVVSRLASLELKVELEEDDF